MKKFLPFAVLLAAAAAAIAGVAKADTSDTQPGERPTAPPVDAAANWAGYGNGVPQARLELLDIVAPGPLNGATAREFRFGTARSLIVARAERGDICFRADRNEANLLAQCTPHFNASGASTATRVATGEPSEVMGLVASDVTAVSIQLGSGDVVNVPIADGAFFWTVPAGQRVVELRTTRGGRSFSETL